MLALSCSPCLAAVYRKWIASVNAEETHPDTLVCPTGVYSSLDELYAGVPPMEPDGQYLLFLTEQDEKDRRCVVGTYQGKFVLREGCHFQQATREFKLPAEEYSLVPVADFPTSDA